jgi:glutamine synthetase
MITVEYIWLDGTTGTQQLRSKTRVFKSNPGQLPDWSFDGGSTNQATVEQSDCILKPVRLYTDPFKQGEERYLALCEVLDKFGAPHISNTRASLTKMHSEGTLFGFEQEYTLIQPDGALLIPEGLESNHYYCGVGFGKTLGRTLSDVHLDMCDKAGITLYGSNAEVMLSQWEFQTQPEEALKASDDLWISRFILARLGEGMEISISYHPKLSPDYNGAGCHTNFSTTATRASWDGIEDVLEALQDNHSDHMKVYGVDNKLRMTGTCETSNYDEFTAGEGDRTASVRIPPATIINRCGYLEDRRPAANCDPYIVTSRILETLIAC